MSAPNAQNMEAGKAAWSAHASSFDGPLRAAGDALVSLDQAHLFAHWGSEAAQRADDKRRFLQQVADVEEAYIGGVRTYVQRAKQLLAASAANANPYEGFVVEEPKDAVRLQAAADFERYEARGMQCAPRTAFVLVAGGLGERLGYKGIKLALPSDITSEMCYLELYCRWVLALQRRARRDSGEATLELQLAIMTSDDTDTMTRQLLQANNNFGMSASQLTVFKQGKVPSMCDNDAHFVLDEKDPFALDTKPHGHGDVHALLYKEGIVQRWVNGQAGNASATPASGSRVLPVEWIVFFQDTNGLVFHSVIASLGVSAERQLHMNSITVPRAQGDAVGAICSLRRQQPKSDSELGPDDLPNQLTINVEYNQLEGLLGKGVKEPVVPGTNYSVLPGNINVLLLHAPDYFKVLEQKKGAISEFVNPKYNPDKQSFKKPTRLECMMQDYPKLLPQGSAVGFTQFERLHAFSAVKNALADGADKQKAGNAAEVAATGEQDMYAWPAHMLQEVGAQVEQGEEKSYRGVRVRFPPHIVFTPAVGTTQAEVRSKLPGGADIRISARSTLVLDGEQVTLRSLQLDGTLILLAHPDAKVTVSGLSVRNDGWRFREIPSEDDAKVEQKYAIRGYTLERMAQACFVFDKPGEYTLSDETRAQFEKEYKHPPRM